MEQVEGARAFQASGDAYDRFMGRYSRELAGPFADAARVAVGQRAIDVGCGPGALTGVLVERLGADAVSAVDPSPSFVEACRTRHPHVDVRVGRAESLPYDDASHDVALMQLVLHFVSDPDLAVSQMSRVVRPGGLVAACVWDFADGMEMLRLYWDAALTVDPDAPDEAQRLRFGRAGEIADLFRSGGLLDVTEGVITVSSTYRDLDELWTSLLAGIGPAGAHCVALGDAERDAVCREIASHVADEGQPFTLNATARWASGRVPG